MSPWRRRYKNLFEPENQVKVKIDCGIPLNFNFCVYVLPVALVRLCWTLLKPRFNHTRVERTSRSKASFSSQVSLKFCMVLEDVVLEEFKSALIEVLLMDVAPCELLWSILSFFFFFF